MDREADVQLPRGMFATLRLLGAAIRLVWAAGRRDFVLIVILQLIQALGFLVLLLQFQQLITALIKANTGDTAEGLAIGLVLFIAANALMGLAGAIINNRRQIIGERVTLYISTEILKVTCLAELDDFDDSTFHDRLQRAAGSAANRPMMMVQSMIDIGQNLFALGSLWFALVMLQPWIGISLLLVAFPVWIGGTRVGEHYFTFVVRIAHLDRARMYLFQLLTMRDPAKEIRAFNLAQHLSERWRTSMIERIGMLASTLRRQLRASVISTFGSNLVLALAAVTLVVLNRRGVLTLAETATVAAAMLMFAQRLLSSVMETNRFFESAPLVNDLNGFLQLGDGLAKHREGAAVVGGFSRIELDDVSFRYRDANRNAVEHADIRINAGEIVALVGENGSGKTTLAKLIAGLYEPRTGAVRIDGTDLKELDLTSWREQVAVLFQDFIRYALTATDNIHLGSTARSEDAEGVRAAALAAGADDFLSRLPSGYDTTLGPQFGRGIDLSLGQWQRVALARAFFRDAPLVVLDEPTASLDARAERDLFESVRQLYRGKTVVLISHRFSTVRTADRIIVLKNGEIVEQGSHTELMAGDGLYAELFAIQASAFLEADLEETAGEPATVEP
ncbi:ABC transporter ATP-binding protein [Dactylosporangium siamense]|uniref:Multidrug ABC transporter permease n=1 Tax=Dactylosporangium siamense TaxID=685454 RepID=A0A919Q062_9ACTN|nr:ABC transporter ATP-binding protein [Dactylosporangium siamense]GIG52476.1 multidrug ABC transporter permease [Dactylosporangium siamense]